MRKIFTVIGFLLLSFSIAACTGATSITFTFETNGGNTIENMVVDTQDTSFELPTPVKEGFIFDGWFINEELTDPFNFATLLTATEITVYAKWTSGIVEYTITFVSNGGSAVAAITLASGAVITAPTQPTKTGFTFGGWYSDVALTTSYSFTVMPAENITLYAKWNAVVIQTTISFVVNGGSAVAQITQNSGTAVVAPTQPTKTGYTFGGWYSDVALTTAYTFNLMPAVNMTLYAKWNINSYILQYLDNEGTILQTTDFEYGASLSGVVPPTASKVGYSFVEWNQDLPVTMPAMNLLLTARYVINQYTITFEENGGSLVADIVQEYMTDVTAPIAPTKAGYTFNGWYSNALLTTVYTFTTMPLDGITLYAKWTATLYTISFEENGGTNVFDITQGYMTSVSAPVAPTKAGYAFAGWYSDIALTTAYTFTTIPMNNLTLYAKWTINQYTISFEENGGVVVDDLTQDYLTVVSAPTTTKQAFTFVGWYSDALLTIPYVFTTMPATNITVYAKWEATVYVISFFDFINGYYAMPALESAAGEIISIPMPEAILGYDFIGWFTDVQFDVPYIETIMPAHDFTLYGLWEVSVYTVSYNSNGGSVIDDADFTYFSEVPNPNAPTKEGYIFAGWYSDETLLLPFDFMDVPLSNITIYAKWILDEGFNPIQLILMNQPTEEVTLKGVIYYKFPDPANPGFYLYDGTGYIFVFSNAMGFNVGDGVEVVGYFGFFENTPQITSVSSINPDGTFVTMPDAVEMSIQQLLETSEYDLNIYGKLVEFTGVVGQDGPNFYLSTLSSDGVAVINYKSYLPVSNPFVTLVGQKVTIRAIIYDFNSHTYEWHIIYDFGQSIIQIPMTDQEKLDELVLFAQTMLDHQEFYNGQTFMIPENEPVYGATLTAETFGVNASFYNPSTGTFVTTTETIEIGLRITITIGLLSESVDLTIILKPIDSLTVAEFIAADEMSYHEVAGIVIFAATLDDMQMMIIADTTGTLAVVSNSEVAVGDSVIVAGYRMSQDGMAMMANQDPSMSLIAIIGHNYPFPIDPIVVSVEQFLGLNANNLLYWLQYFEVTGRLEYDNMMRTFVIEDELSRLPIFAFNNDAMEVLNSYEGLIVSIRGISLPNFDQQQPFLMLVFTGRPEDIVLNYSDEDLVAEMVTLLTNLLSSPTYYPGQIVELPTEHPTILMSATYEAFGVNAGLIDVATGEISATIESEVWIDLHVTITIGLISEIFDIQLHVAPITILSVSQFNELTDYDFPYYVTGTVIFTQPKEFMYIIADENHIIFVMASTQLDLGDIIIAFGYKVHEGGMIMLVGDFGDTIVDISSHDNPNPLIKSIISIGDFILMNMSLPENIFRYFQIAGTLVENQEFHIFFLSDGENDLAVFPASTEAYQALIPFSGMEVLISGLAMPNPEDPESDSMLVFINFPGDVIPNMTPAEFAVYVADSTVSKYLISTFRPGTTHILKDDYPTFNLTIVYETTGVNADKYNVETGWISGDITEELYIDINATSYLDGIVFDTYSFQIHVVPIPS